MIDLEWDTPECELKEAFEHEEVQRMALDMAGNLDEFQYQVGTGVDGKPFGQCWFFAEEGSLCIDKFTDNYLGVMTMVHNAFLKGRE